MQNGGLTMTIFPRGYISIIFVVSKGFAIFGLILFAEVASTTLISVQGIVAHQLAQF
jgi:hypothetical protein